MLPRVSAQKPAPERASTWSLPAMTALRAAATVVLGEIMFAEKTALRLQGIEPQAISQRTSSSVCNHAALAVSAGLWTVADLGAFVESAEPQVGKRGPYKKRTAQRCEPSQSGCIGAPRNTPAEIIDTLNKEINAALADPNMKDR